MGSEGQQGADLGGREVGIHPSTRAGEGGVSWSTVLPWLADEGGQLVSGGTAEEGLEDVGDESLTLALRGEGEVEGEVEGRGRGRREVGDEGVGGAEAGAVIRKQQKRMSK